MAFYLAYLLTFYLTFYLTYFLAFYLAVEVQRCTLSWAGPRLRSSGAHWAGQVPGWGPAVHTELGSSQVEVQRCTLSWAARRLRSSGKHWAGQLAGWRPAVRTSSCGKASPLEARPLPIKGKINTKPYNKINQNQTKIIRYPSPAGVPGAGDCR